MVIDMTSFQEILSNVQVTVKSIRYLGPSDDFPEESQNPFLMSGGVVESLTRCGKVKGASIMKHPDGKFFDLRIILESKVLKPLHIRPDNMDGSLLLAAIEQRAFTYFECTFENIRFYRSRADLSEEERKTSLSQGWDIATYYPDLKLPHTFYFQMALKAILLKALCDSVSIGGDEVTIHFRGCDIFDDVGPRLPRQDHTLQDATEVMHHRLEVLTYEYLGKYADALADAFLKNRFFIQDTIDSEARLGFLS